MPLIDSINERATRYRDSLYARFNAQWEKQILRLARFFDPLIAKLVGLDPLPEWTNKHLALFGLAVWAFAISLSWLADSRTFVIGGLTVLGVWFIAIFIRAESSST